MRRRGSASISASPVLVGAVAVLVTCIAVMIAVKANSGLPFVPSYDVRAEIPGGSNLVVGNEVRIGGFRVGVVDRIEPAVSEAADGRAVAVIHMKLEKRYGELPARHGARHPPALGPRPQVHRAQPRQLEADAPSGREARAREFDEAGRARRVLLHLGRRHAP